jgi:hypothetical protein
VDAQHGGQDGADEAERDDTVLVNPHGNVADAGEVDRGRDAEDDEGFNMAAEAHQARGRVKTAGQHEGENAHEVEQEDDPDAGELDEGVPTHAAGPTAQGSKGLRFRATRPAPRGTPRR